MASWILLATLVLAFLLVVCLVLFLAKLDEHRCMQERLGRVVKRTQMVKHPERPSDIPEFCPICARRMSWPVGAAKVVALTGSEVLLVCSYCLVLGPMDSAISAAAENDVPPHRAELAQLCGVFATKWLSATLPGGGSPAAGTF